MKTIKVKLTDGTNSFAWTIKWEGIATFCGQPLRKAYKANCWTFKSHDGCTRTVEGNWRDLVPAFKLTADNYGLTLTSELS